MGSSYQNQTKSGKGRRRGKLPMVSASKGEGCMAAIDRPFVDVFSKKKEELRQEIPIS